jgi:hypothetical protein
MMAVDPDGRRLYTTFRRDGSYMLGTYDLATAVPTLISQRPVAEGTVSDATPYTSLLEPKRRRLYQLAGGVVGQMGTSNLLVFGADGNPMPSERWDMANILPGFYPGGMTYSAEDDRIYLIGEMSESMYVMTSTLTFGNKAAGGPAAVVAIDPTDGKLLWSRVVPECRFPLYTLFTGSLIARSSPRLPSPTLFFPCSPGSTTFGTNLPYQPGLTALTIAPKATMVDAQGFDVRYYPISGNFFNGAQTGIAGYDYTTDRLFLQSLSNSTPGAWVFDAHQDGWVGAITAPNALDQWLGVNQKSGHYYMGGTSGGIDHSRNFLLVADGRTRRPQNGVNAGSAYGPTSYIFTDPVTDRLFINQGPSQPFLVLKDLTESVRPQDSPDYDGQTDDVAETTGTFISFTGDAGGFGTRVTVVGDTASVNGSLPFAINPVPQASRSVTLARGPSTNLQPAGAAAAAQAASIDTTTGQNLRSDPRLPAWPYGTETCLDGGDGVSNQPEQTTTGFASVTCNLRGFEAASEARQAGAALSATVGDSRYQSSTKRTLKDGITTKSASSSSGVHIDVPGAGSIDIGKVSSEAVTVAHGRAGTATATWSRAIDGVTVKDASGAVVFQSGGCATKVVHDGKKLTASGSTTTCDQVAEGVRKALQVNVRLFFPTAAVQATPKGALAMVGQTDADQAKENTVNDQGQLYAGDSSTRRVVPALQIELYHDSIERSRDIVQLAGVESTAIFTVNRSPADAPCDTGGCIPGGLDVLASPTGGGAASLAASSPSGASAPTDGSSTATPGPAPQGVGAGARNGPARSRPVAPTPRAVGLILLRRSLGQGVLMAAFLVLAGAALAGVARRQRLLDLLRSR